MRRVEALVTGSVPKDWMERLRSFSESNGCSAVLVNADIVEGTVHIESAVEHAERAFSAGCNRSRGLEVETILYLTGKRRIERALKMSAPGERNVVIVIDGSAEEAIGTLGLEGGTLPRTTERTYDALERTALLDLEK